ncbi:hypothetical protein MRS44_010728 [Fusarium solani]|uniref:uncharacterized protein n=1 Tax=Fusarium solani TaxID=169388 RepID=UPI0032C4145A|nr:hypothetical protein MRS44_010728 [Fusarium solani]
MRSEAVPLRRLQAFLDESTVRPAAGRFLVPGTADADIVFSDTPISFMMGVNAETGVVMDEHHPLLGVPLQGKAFALRKGRGSCASSAVILELLYLGKAPSALIFREMDPILVLGVLLAGALYSKSIPVVLIEDDAAWAKVFKAESCRITSKDLMIGDELVSLDRPYSQSVETTPEDERMLRGEGYDPATQMAMELIVEFASIQGAKDLTTVSQVHIDACCLVGQTSLLVPQRLLELGGRVRVPATCNSLDVDRQRWRALGTDPDISQFASKIGDAYLAMGATMSFTCAPVLGARTQKYPDYLDVLIALTGRAPVMGCHLDEGRRPTMSFHINTDELTGFDDSPFPLLGYHIGSLVGGDIPTISGLESSNPGVPDLKAFSAGFATTSSAAMFHIRGVTPEADTVVVPKEIPEMTIGRRELAETWLQLQSAKNDTVDIISLGNPHFALEEFPRLIHLIKNKTKSPKVAMVITTSRFVYKKAKESGDRDVVVKFGAQFITDTCWCMLKEPVIPHKAQNIMTISAKYAHYGPGVSGRGVAFGSLADAVEAACTGTRPLAPTWLFGLQEVDA